jgi:hypothetical protein
MTLQDALTYATTFFPIVLQVVGVASAIAALTPTPKDDGILLIVRKGLDYIALNVLHSKNK